jgi:hypothetical protein
LAGLDVPGGLFRIVSGDHFLPPEKASVAVAATHESRSRRNKVSQKIIVPFTSLGFIGLLVIPHWIIASDGLTSRRM